MKETLTWEDFPRTKDKVAIVGFALATRDFTPWDDDSYEIWSLNEGYNFPWMKRYDRWFQIHPRWDFQKEDNLNDPNHYYWLLNQEKSCRVCGGLGYGKNRKGDDAPCGACKDGTYVPPENRKDLPIYMQKHWDDIPNSIPLPLDEIHDTFFRKFLGKDKYFTSSVAYMLGLAMLMGFKRIEFYGFEMGTNSEYHYQRANFEFMCGVALQMGIEIYIPQQSPILKGELYGFENMQQGYRQNQEMRKVFLKMKEEESRFNMSKLAGAVEALKETERKDDPEFVEIMNKYLNNYHQALGLVNVYSGAIREVENMINMYDRYFRQGLESERDRQTDEIVTKENVNLEYRDGA